MLVKVIMEYGKLNESTKYMFITVRIKEVGLLLRYTYNRTKSKNKNLQETETLLNMIIQRLFSSSISLTLINNKIISFSLKDLVPYQLHSFAELTTNIHNNKRESRMKVLYETHLLF